MTRTEAERLAAMAHAVRPDWPIPSLMTLLTTHYAKAYRDVAVALAWIATDPQTKTPGRLNESGPWWKATQAGEATFVARTHMCPDHPTERAWDCGPCTDRATTDYQTQLRNLRDVARKAKTR